MLRFRSLSLLAVLGLLSACGTTVNLIDHPQTTPDAGVDAQGTEPPPPLRVLFLGNSYTEVNDLPNQVRAIAMSATRAPTVTVEAITVAGATLQQLYTSSDALARVRAGGWTHVVMQGQSVEALSQWKTSEGFLVFAKKFGDEAKAVGAVPVYYETWARRAGDPLYKEWNLTPATWQAQVRASYQEAAQSVGGVFAPAGDAWELSLAEASPVTLFQDDGSHPNLNGTYLTGCVFYRALTQQKCAGLGGAPPGVTNTDAARLQAVADRTPGL